MKTKTLMTLATVLLMVGLTPITLGANDEDREAPYTGVTVGVPPGALHPPCDTTDPWPLVWNPGGALFCNLPQEIEIQVDVHDDVTTAVIGIVTCLKSTGYEPIDTFDKGTSLVLPGDCIAHPDDETDSTRVGVFNHQDATAGTITLIHL